MLRKAVKQEYMAGQCAEAFFFWFITSSHGNVPLRGSHIKQETEHRLFGIQNETQRGEVERSCWWATNTS